MVRGEEIMLPASYCAWVVVRGEEVMPPPAIVRESWSGVKR